MPVIKAIRPARSKALRIYDTIVAACFRRLDV
jgi:hypothetical protein